VAGDEQAVRLYTLRKQAQGKHRLSGTLSPIRRLSGTLSPIRRRGGGDLCRGALPSHNESTTMRYPEVRGLRFSPESGMYLDPGPFGGAHDSQAAVHGAIAAPKSNGTGTSIILRRRVLFVGVLL
jgi:hypothetical protein